MTVTFDCGSMDTHVYRAIICEVTEYDSSDAIGATGGDGALATNGADSVALSGTTVSTSLVFGFLWKDWDGTSGASVLEGSGWTEILDSTSTYFGTHGQVITGLESNVVSWQDTNTTATTTYKVGGVGIEINAASSSSGNPWYYYAQQMRQKLEEKLKRRILIPGFADCMRYGYSR